MIKTAQKNTGNNIIGDNIKLIRKNANRLTQQAFGKMLGCTGRNIGSYEEGRANPPLEILISISELTWIPLNDLTENDLSKKDIEELIIKKTSRKILNTDNDKVVAVITISPKKQLWITEKTIA